MPREVPQAPPATERAPEARSKAEEDTNWRSGRAPQKPVVVVQGNWRAKQGVLLPDGTHVATPYGPGTVVRAAGEGQLQVRFTWGGMGYLRASEVKPTRSKVVSGEVDTPYGRGVLRNVRFADLVRLCMPGREG